MAVKYKYQVEQIPTGVNAQQIEDFFNQQGQNGWNILQIFPVGSNMYVLAQKALTA